MQKLNGKMANRVAVGVVIAGLPLLAFIVLVFQLAEARSAGHPFNGGAIGLAIMSVAAFCLFLQTYSISAVP